MAANYLSTIFFKNVLKLTKRAIPCRCNTISSFYLYEFSVDVLFVICFSRVYSYRSKIYMVRTKLLICINKFVVSRVVKYESFSLVPSVNINTIFQYYILSRLCRKTKKKNCCFLSIVVIKRDEIRMSYCSLFEYY